MSGYTFDGPVRPPGDEWPAGVLPPPCLTVEIAAIGLEVLIEHHESYGADARAKRERDVELFHMACASYLRQRLAMVAPHRLTPDRKGHA
jgi:hypothetical protein